MNAYTRDIYTRDVDAAECCAFCGTSLPIVNGQLEPWRASSGEFFCNEFCADDAEEVRFQRHGRVGREVHERWSARSNTINPTR